MLLKTGLILLLSMTVVTQALYAQATDSAKPGVLDFPSRLFARLQKKSADLNQQLTKQTEKYLERMARQEARLKKKLSHTDSAAASRLFAGSSQQYAAMIQKFKGDTTISKSVPLTEQYSLTLQNGYSMVQQGLVPVPGIAAHATRTYETEQSAKLSIDDTGTSLTAGQTLSSSDEKWLHKFGAEQKLSDGVSVSGSIGETAQGTTSKSITAGFKRSW